MTEPQDAGEQPWDVGLQSERTALAWHRTLLSGLVCSLVVARLVALVSWPAAVVTGLVAVATTAILAVLARRRFRHNDAAVRLDDPLADARAPALLCVLVVVTALAAVLVVLGGSA